MQSPINPGFTRVYRAISEAEYRDILLKGRFQNGPNFMEGKWFADTLEGVLAHALGLYPDGDYRIVVAEISDDAPSLFQHPNLDGNGPSRYLHIDDLASVIPRLFSS